ncbi:SusC, outer membrane protein [Aquipluma nitroreducens]|uniref:SusC, outer membrane protein n=2 Tax=Aquipluma nitroreducens TaxID=2010828 RepID=A0A5K7SG42_9BACT|nr:SusC, outer membrane protein [Aquipluma nitroreducens]
MFRMVRFTLFCFFLSLIQVMALDSYSQQTRISLNQHDQRLEEVLKTIEDKSEFFFLYNRDLINVNQKVNINASNQTINRILDELLKGTDISYSVVNRQIILSNLEGISGLTAQQQKSISGKVTDSSGGSLPGVSVVVKGTTTGTITDSNGNYLLANVPGNATLQFSFVGMKTQEIVIGGKATINITLADETIGLDEVVAVGYATQRKEDLTGAVSVVNMKELAQQPIGTVTSQLQGRASGVTILGGGQPGETPQIRIRGINTFGNNTPLFVVDGMPTTNINNLNPDDILTMQVLKDASASIYGSRAANGVIILTTKAGSGKIKVQYDAYYGIQTVEQGNVWDLNSPQELADLKWSAMKNSNPGVAINDPLYGNGAKPVLPDYIYPIGLLEGDPRVNPSLYNVNPFYTNVADIQNFYRITKANKLGTDWFHEIFSAAPTMKHNLEVSGGNENAKYLFSMNYLNQEGTLINTYLKRYILRANIQFNVTKRIRVGENIAFSVRSNPQVNALYEGSPIGYAIREQSIIPVHDIMGNYGGAYGGILGDAKNPVAMLERNKNNKQMESSLFGNVFGEFDVIDDLTLRTSFGGAISNGQYRSFNFPEYENGENNPANYYSESANNNYNWTWTNTLQYKKVLNDIHKLTLIAGTEAYQNSGGTVGGTTYDYFSFDPNFTTLSTGSGTQTNYSSKYVDALFSYIGRLDYIYNDKYLLGATIRRDGSSRFLNKQYGWFPAVSAAWRISKESFMQGANLEWIDDLKLRTGYGIMGNQLNVDAANAFTTYGSDRVLSSYDITGSGNSLIEGFKKNRVGNPDAEWEKNINLNIGLDATLFKGKLNLTIDYYRKDIKDMLYNPDLIGTAGLASKPFVNVAAMRNKGIDLSASTFFNITKDLKLDASLTFTSFNNKILNVSNLASYFDIDSRRFSGSTIVRNAVGHSVGQFYGFKTDGFWNSQEEIDAANASVRNTEDPNAVYQSDVKVGRFRYADTNGDGKITFDDRTFLGNPNPDFSYGLNLGLNYKNFDFGIFFYGVSGNDIWNNVLWWTDFYSNLKGPKSHTALNNSWTPQNHNAKAPIQEELGSFSSSSVPNSYFVENGSYLRAKNIQIGYTFSPKLLELVKIDKLRIYFQAENLFTITKYSGLDPEVSGNSVNFGIDEGSYPTPKQFLMGVNLTF